MATTSGNLTAGAASTAQGGHGTGGKRRAAGLLATAALGLALLGGLAFGQVQREAPAAAAPMSSTPAVVAATHGSGPADEYTPPEEFGPRGAVSGDNGTTAPRTDGEDCLLGAPVPCGFRRGGPPAPTHGRGPADEYTQADSDTGHGTATAP
jgi:hypothetical protein